MIIILSEIFNSAIYHFNPHAIPLFAIGALIFFSGIFVLYKKNLSLTGITFFLMSLSASIWLLATGMAYLCKNENIAVIWFKIDNFGVVFLSTTVYSFVVSFLGIPEKRKIPIISAYATSLVLGISIVTTNLLDVGVRSFFWGFFPKWGILVYALFPFFYAYMLASFIELVIAFTQSSSPSVKNQILYLFAAFGIAYTSSIDYFATFGIPIYPIGFLSMSLYFFITAYAIVKHRLMDIEVVIKKGFVYSMLIASVFAVYSFSLLLLQTIFQGLGLNSWLAGVITAFAIAVGYRPLEFILIEFTDRYFFKKKYGYRKTLVEMSKGLNQLMPLEVFVKLLLRRIVRTIRLKGGAALFLDEKENIYVAIAAERNMVSLKGQKFVFGDTIISESAKKDYLLLDDIEEDIRNTRPGDPKRGRIEALRDKMRELSICLSVPIRFENKVIGTALLGEKLSEDTFSDEDLDLLVTLSVQAGMALVNVRIYSEALEKFRAEEEKTTLLQKQLDRSQRLASLGTIAAGVAHEIRNPLGIIHSKTEKLDDEPRDIEYLGAFKEAVLRNSKRISSIITNMLSLTKVKEKKLEEINFNEVIESTLQLFTISKIKLIKDLREIPYIRGDIDELKEVLINLINNATEAMPEGGDLTIRTYQAENHVFLEVSDTGRGIPSENLDKIFDPFFSTRHEGAGLGLSIVYRIVREHGGNIEVKSEENKGSTFIVKFPLMRE